VRGGKENRKTLANALPIEAIWGRDESSSTYHSDARPSGMVNLVFTKREAGGVERIGLPQKLKGARIP